MLEQEEIGRTVLDLMTAVRLLPEDCVKGLTPAAEEEAEGTVLDLLTTVRLVPEGSAVILA